MLAAVKTSLLSVGCCFALTHHPQSGSRGKLSKLVDNETCLFCQLQAVPIDFNSGADGIQFDCLTDVNGEVGILAEIPYQVEFPPDFVEEYITELQSGLWDVCIPGGRAVRFPNSTLPDQILIPEGADIQLVPGLVDPGQGDGLGFGNRTVLVVRVTGTAQSPEESEEQMKGAVFGLGRQPLANSMRAQYRRCSFSKIDFLPATGFAQFDDGVLNIQMNYNLRGRTVTRVVNDASTSVADLLGIDSLRSFFDHVVFCIARGTTYPRRGETEWLAFAHLNGYQSVFNSERCDSLSVLMHEIGHNLGLVHAADDFIFIGDQYGDTTGVVSCTVAQRGIICLPLMSCAFLGCSLCFL